MEDDGYQPGVLRMAEQALESRYAQLRYYRTDNVMLAHILPEMQQ